MTEKQYEDKKAKLKESLINTLELALETYPQIKDLLKKDLTIEKMANDLISSLEELSPEVIKDLKGTKLAKLKALTKLKKLKI